VQGQRRRAGVHGGGGEGALDHGERVALGQHLADEQQPGHVLAAVEAGATDHPGRREETAGGVRAEVAHRDADARGELVDRQFLVDIDVGTIVLVRALTGRDHGHLLSSVTFHGMRSFMYQLSMSPSWVFHSPHGPWEFPCCSPLTHAPPEELRSAR
jgi:hypothetical protein